MKIKVRIKWILDVLMTIALFFLMGYQFWGESIHEWIGAGMFVLFIDILTLAAMLVLMYSGINMSRHVFAFLPMRGGMALTRRLHILGSYWGYLLMSLHLGLHWGMVLNVFGKRRAAQQKYSITGFMISLIIATYGMYVFIRRDFPTYLFLRSEFVFLDYDEPRLLFLMDYLALMGVCIFIIHYGAKLLKKTGARRKGADSESKTV